MMISKAMQRIVRVLLNQEKRISLRALAEKAGVSLGIAARITNELVKTGYIKKRAGITVVNKGKLLNAWAYAVSVNENKKIEFIAAERPQYLIKAIARKSADRLYAFTLFSGAEVIAPYVVPDKIHMYILADDKEKWKKIFMGIGMAPAEKGNVVCFLVDKHYFYGSRMIRGINVISIPQLYVDLFSYSGRGIEAAEHLIKVSRYV